MLDLNDVEIFLDVKATMQVLSLMYRRSYEFPDDDLTALRSFIEYKKEYKKEVVDRVCKELRELEYGHTTIHRAMNKVYSIYSDDYKELEDQLQLVSFENLNSYWRYSRPYNMSKKNPTKGLSSRNDYWLLPVVRFRLMV